MELVDYNFEGGGGGGQFHYCKTFLIGIPSDQLIMFELDGVGNRGDLI